MVFVRSKDPAERSVCGQLSPKGRLCVCVCQSLFPKALCSLNLLQQRVRNLYVSVVTTEDQTLQRCKRTCSLAHGSLLGLLGELCDCMQI